MENMYTKNFLVRLLLGAQVLLLVPVFAFADTVSNVNQIAVLRDRVAALQSLVLQLQEQVQTKLGGPQVNGFSGVVIGSRAAHLATISIDASGLLEDIKTSALHLTLVAPQDYSQQGLSACALFDNGRVLGTNANTVTPTARVEDVYSYVFNFDTALTVLKGSIKTLELRCDVTSQSHNSVTYAWGLAKAPATFVGVTTGASLSPKISSDGPARTLLPYGNFSVALDASNPAASVVAGGTEDVAVGTLRFSASGESVELKDLGLQIDGPNRYAVAGYSIWDGDRKVGGGLLDGKDYNIIAHLDSGVVIPQDGMKLLTIKAAFAPAGYAERAQAGDTIAINYNGSDGNHYLTRGLGLSSGNVVSSAANEDTQSARVTLAASVAAAPAPLPAGVSYEKLPLPANELLNGLMVLYRFKAKAPADKKVSLSSFLFHLTNSEVGVKDLKVYAFSDPDFTLEAFSVNPIGRRLGQWYGSDNTLADITLENGGLPLEIPAGGAYYVELRGTVSSRTPNAFITTALDGLSLGTLK